MASEVTDRTEVNNASSPTTFGTLPKKQLVGTIIGLQLTLLLAALDQTIVATAMPRIIASLNGFDRYAWVTTAYMLASTAATPIFGRLSDIYGRKWIFLAGIAMFILTSALCGAAGSIPGVPLDGMSQLIIARGLQGIAGGIIMAIVFTVIADIFPPAERGKYMGLFAGVWGLAAMIGPVLGGWLTDQFSWRSIFYINLPVGMIALTVIYFAFPFIRPEGVQRKIDFAGSAALIGFLVPLLVGVGMASTAGWLAPTVLGCFALAGALIWLFFKIEKTAIEPIMPPILLQTREIRTSVIVIACVSAAMFDAILFAPLFLQALMNVSATQAGTLFTALPLAMSSSSTTAGQIISRTKRYKTLTLCGLTALTISMFFLSRLNGTCSPLLFVLLLIGVGIGSGFTMPSFTLVVQSAAPPNMMGAATAMCQFWRSVGATIGAAVLGSVMQSRYLQHLDTSSITTHKDLLAEVQNPTHFAQIKNQILSTYGSTPQGIAMVQSLFAKVGEALTFALNGTFLIGACICAVALVATFFLKEKPLRSK